MLESVVEGLAFPEGLRWHEDALWYSDMHSGEVHRWAGSAGDRVVLTVDDSVSGLGWDTYGRLLVVSMNARRLLRFEPARRVDTARPADPAHPARPADPADSADPAEPDQQGVKALVLADLSSYTSHPINDMTVDLSGTAYVGSFGFDLYGRGAPAPAGVIKVAQDGSHSLAAGDLQFPNGMVVADGGATLVVAETFAGRLTAFTRRDDGSLTDRRTWAQLAEGVSPDGICLDRRGAIWVASPTTRECLRVLEGGEVTDRITVGGRMAVSCTLGGADGASLFVATSGHLSPAGTRKHRDGRIEVTRVPA